MVERRHCPRGTEPQRDAAAVAPVVQVFMRGADVFEERREGASLRGAVVGDEIDVVGRAGGRDSVAELGQTHGRQVSLEVGVWRGVAVPSGRNLDLDAAKALLEIGRAPARERWPTS